VTAKRGGNLGSVTAGLLRLLDRFGSQELELSIAEALERDSPPLPTVFIVFISSSKINIII